MTNPHITDDEDRRALWDQFQAMLEDREVVEDIPELDVSAFQFLKIKASENPRIVVKS